MLSENLYNLVNGKQLYWKLLNFSVVSLFTVACLPSSFPLYMSPLLVTTGLASDLSWLQTLNHNSLLFLNKLIYCWRNNSFILGQQKRIFTKGITEYGYKPVGTGRTCLQMDHEDLGPKKCRDFKLLKGEFVDIGKHSHDSGFYLLLRSCFCDVTEVDHFFKHSLHICFFHFSLKQI